MGACTSAEEAEITEKTDLIIQESRFEVIFQETQPVFSVTDVCVNDEGYYLVSGRQNLLSQFNESGEMIRYHSRSGRGPGDLAMPIRMYCNHNTLYLLEANNTRIQRFDLDFNSLNSISLRFLPFNFSVYDDEIFVSGNDYVRRKYLSLHKVNENGTYQESAFEDKDYPIYTYSQSNFHGIVSAWHKYDNVIHLFDKDLHNFKTIHLPDDIFTSLYHPSVYPGEIDDSNLLDAMRNYSYWSIEFASATPYYLLVQMRPVNFQNEPHKVAVYQFDKNEWLITALNREQRFFQHHQTELYSYVFDEESEWGSLEIIKYQINLADE